MTPRGRTPSLTDAETLREFVENVRVGMYVTSPEGSFVDANPAMLEILGVESIEVLKTHHVDDFLADPTQRPRVLEAMDSDGQARDVVLELRRADGQLQLRGHPQPPRAGPDDLLSRRVRGGA